MLSKLFKQILPGIIILFFAGFTSAASLDQKIISDIQVQGNQRIPTSELLTWVKTKVGDKVDASRMLIDRDLKGLWATGKFEDVNFSFVPLSDGTIRLVMLVEEKALIHEILFQGQKAFEEKKLLEEAGLKPGLPYDTFVLDTAAKKMVDYYKGKEYYQAKVTHSIKRKDEKISVVFQIEEGMKVKITTIRVLGNVAFSEGKIKGVMETKEAGWFVGGIYKEDTLIEDVKKVLVLYAKEGYLKAKLFDTQLQDVDLNRKTILEQALSVDPVKKEMTLTLKVAEGSQYKVKSISIKGNIIYSQEELTERMDIKPGVILDRVAFENDMRNVRMAYSEKGYIFADISPEMEYMDDAGTVAVMILVREGTIARVERIDIRGNTITKEKVIRREITVNPGEPFDSRRIQHSKEKITNLGFFQDVKINTEPGSSPNEQVLVFEVEERHTGTISLGAGYSSVDYLMGYLQLTQANLFGNGQSVSLQWELGSLRQSWQMSFTEPWLFDSPVSFGVDIWDINKNKGYNGQLYHLLSQGGDIRLGRRFSDEWKGYLTYKLESNEYSEVDSSLLSSVRPERSDTSSVTPTLVYDTRDNIFDPSTGLYQRGSVEIAGGALGGDNNFVKYSMDSSMFVPLIWKFVLALHGEAGYVYGYDFGVNGNTLPPPDVLFRMGGTDSVRGYGEGIFGKDLPRGGGSLKLGYNLEIHYPIIGPLKGVAFLDAGNAWADLHGLESNPSVYKGAGMGIRLTVPGTVILIRFDFGYPLDPDPTGKAPSLNYHFNIGNIF